MEWSSLNEHMDHRFDEVMDALREVGLQMGIDIYQHLPTRRGVDSSLKTRNVSSHRVFPISEKRSHQCYVNPYDRHVREPFECLTSVEKEMMTDHIPLIKNNPPTDFKKFTIKNTMEPLECPGKAITENFIQDDKPSVDKEALSIEVVKPLECPSTLGHENLPCVDKETIDIVNSPKCPSAELMIEHPTHPVEPVPLHSNFPNPKSATPISPLIPKLHTEVEHYFALDTKPFTNDHQCFQISNENNYVMASNSPKDCTQYFPEQFYGHDFVLSSNFCKLGLNAHLLKLPPDKAISPVFIDLSPYKGIFEPPILLFDDFIGAELPKASIPTPRGVTHFEATNILLDTQQRSTYSGSLYYYLVYWKGFPY